MNIRGIIKESIKTILNESGIRNIREIAARYPKAEIYFHQDLDGVATAIAMREYLSRNGVTTIAAHNIQYGDKEFSAKKPSAEGDVMPVLVDFAHGKPMFVIHTDHHDSQAGVEKDTATSFRSSKSNVETISQLLSPTDIFPDKDIMLISTVDSADYARHGLKPNEVMNAVFKLDKERTFEQNKMAMGLVTNKLLLAHKNKPDFLETLVMEATPSLLNIYQHIVRLAKERGLASPEDIKRNNENYVKTMINSHLVKYEDKIIIQYGGGNMFKPGSYDRYTPFRNFPDADFLVIGWPMGLVQASCNPFKENRGLKGVNLGEIAKEVLNGIKDKLVNKFVALDRIKWTNERSKQMTEESFGFKYSDLIALYKDKLVGVTDENNEAIKTTVDKTYSELTNTERRLLKEVTISYWDILEANSGGHKCITNISGLSYFNDVTTAVKFFQSKMVKALKEKNI